VKIFHTRKLEEGGKSSLNSWGGLRDRTEKRRNSQFTEGRTLSFEEVGISLVSQNGKKGMEMFFGRKEKGKGPEKEKASLSPRQWRAIP